jgi:hypothetical protein
VYDDYCTDKQEHPPKGWEAEAKQLQDHPNSCRGNDEDETVK